MNHGHGRRPVMLLMAAFSRHPTALAWARRRAERQWGPTALVSEPFPFWQTDYYAATMGTGLQKVFWAFHRPFDPALLADAKRIAGEWEADCVREFDFAEPRPLNLDPGYLSEAKLVLASTKDHWHRVYLRDGIFAEVTLHFQDRDWRSHPWTYPDYRQPEYHEFFSRCRQHLRDRPPCRPGTGEEHAWPC
jgi:hypothetical protein